MVIRIFRRKFAVYGRLRQDTARFCAVFRRNTGTRNTDRLQCRNCIVYGRMYTVFSLGTAVNHRPGLQSNTIYKRSVYHRIDAVFFDQGIFTIIRRYSNI